MSDVELTWRVHLARRNPRRTIASLLVVVAGTLAAWAGFRSVTAGILTLFLLLASISDYLFPVRFRLNQTGIEARGLLFRRRMRWPEVRQIRRDPQGVKLSPLSRHSRLEAYRGIYLWFGENEFEVMDVIAHYRPGGETAVGSD